MYKHTLVLIAMVLGTSAQAATTCPDLGGKWVGSCQTKSGNYHALNTYLQPLVKKMQADEMVIDQQDASSPLACRLLTVSGQSVVVDGLRSENIALPVDGVGTINMGFSGGSIWEGQTLSGKASGYIQLPGTPMVNYTSYDAITKKDKDTLERSGRAFGEGFDLTVSCIYKRL